MQQSEDDANKSETNVAEQSQMESDIQCLGLPWIFWDLLCMIKQQKSTVLMHEVKEIKCRPKSFLHKISFEIASVKIKNPDEASKAIRVELLRRLCGLNASNEDGIKLIPFGSIINHRANSASTLDIFVDIDPFHQPSNPLETKLERFPKIATILAEQVRGELVKSIWLKPTNKLRILNVLDTTMEITLFSDSNCLLRTAYIVSAMVLNKWAVPVLSVVLAWGRNTGISSSSGDSLLSEEELVITFLHFMLAKYGNSLSEDILRRSRNLLMENHFHTCRLDECTHIEMRESVTSERMLTREPVEVCVKSDPVVTYTNLVSKPEEETRCGQAVLVFFHFYGLSRGSALKEVPDPGRVNYRQRLLNLKDLEYIQLGEQMMQACHSLANCSTVDDFLHPSCQEDRRFTMILPNEVSSIIKYVETGWDEILTQETGVTFVNIRKKMFRGLETGHIIEAWGNAEAITSLKVRIHRIIGSAPDFLLTNRWRNRWSISGAYRMVFEGATGPESKFEICRYNGRCQRWHNEREKQVPRVIDADPSDTYSAGDVISHFENQRLFLRRNYRINVHGRIRVAVSFGNFYMFGFEVDEMKVGELSRKLSETPSGKKAKPMSHDEVAANYRPMPDLGVSSRPVVHENIDPRRNTEPHWDDLGLRNPSNFNRPKSIGSTFIPSQNLNLERLMDFLKRHNFEGTERVHEYRPTIKMKDLDGIIALDENLELTMFHLQDIRWCVFNVSRCRTDLNPQPTDIRIKIHSRPIITAEELAKRIGCEDLLENAHNLLHRNSAGEVDGIALDEYKDRISYMRYKDMTSYRFRGKTESRRDDDQDNFLNRITFKLNRGKEYKVPIDGIFTENTDQTELILETELPDLEDKEECEEFMREIYEFSKDFAQRFVD